MLVNRCKTISSGKNVEKYSTQIKIAEDIIKSHVMTKKYRYKEEDR